MHLGLSVGCLQEDGHMGQWNSTGTRKSHLECGGTNQQQPSEMTAGEPEASQCSALASAAGGRGHL